MKLTLNEVKAMNEVAGTQLTKEQEIAFIKDRLQELEFGTQKAFDTYKKSHDMRPDTKVKVAGKNTTVAQASKKSGEKATNNIFLASPKPKKLSSSDIEKELNRISGGKGYAQKNDIGNIEYNMGDGDRPTYTLFIGDDEIEKGKVAVQLSPTYGNNPAKLDIYKSFDNEKEAIKHAAMLAKKHRKELEMQDSE